MTISIKLQKVLFKLGNLYFPFNYLSPERLQEIINHIRLIELQQDEILQLRSSASEDYLYLMEGEIDLVCEDSIRTISHPEETQRSPVRLPRHQSCRIIAKTDCIISHAKREILDNIIAWDYIGRETRDTIKYIDIVRNTLVFQRLPVTYIENAFSCMKPHHFKKGESISADESDAYYLILNGCAEVQTYNEARQKHRTVTRLETGDIFGDKAQLSSKNSNETVTMLEDTDVLILGESDYQNLINRPQVRTVQPQVAKTMLDNGYELLDVRFPEEHSESRIPGASIIPLSALSKRLHELNKNTPYIIYCYSGPMSAIASLILHEHNYEALSLEGGIRDWPYEIEHPSAIPNIVAITKKFH
ncbi:hypothetical protein MNBD_GAMMA09-3717 [hydrothermal vent metagenome]|uniref:Uncharacterized protein n=1 Tax=hydrothermal vent metagenome TaxID=652676 RepID=A0A3B0Y521_9ZZZZ